MSRPEFTYEIRPSIDHPDKVFITRYRLGRYEKHITVDANLVDHLESLIDYHEGFVPSD